MTDRYNIGRHYGLVAQASADFPALVGSDVALSHGQLWAVTNGLARTLAAQGVGPGSAVVLNASTMVVVVATLLATGLLGAGFAMATPALAQARVITPTHYFRTADMAGHPAAPFRVLDPDWARLDQDGRTPLPAQPTDPDAPWLYLHTSGTTGTPKFIGLSQRIVRDRSLAAASDFPARSTTFATTFSCTSRPFFARALAALLQGNAIVEGQDTDLWLDHGVNLVAGSPLQLTTLFGDRALRRKIARLEVSGAKMPAGTARALLRSFEQVTDVYGASETSKSFANDVGLDATGAVVVRGHPLDSTVEIVGPDRRPCPPGQVGSVRVRNGYLAPGYLAADAQSHAAFHDGWFYPGDLAMWGEQGDLVVIGRTDDVINLGGFKLHGALIDQLIGSVPGVREAVAFRNPIPGASDPLLVFVIYDDTGDRAAINAQVVDLVQRSFGFGLGDRNLKTMRDLPRDASGSPDRRKCADLVLARARDLGELA